MTPGAFDFRVFRGDDCPLAEAIAVRPLELDVLSGEWRPVSMAGKVAHWSIALPDGAVEVTSTAGGVLTYDTTDAFVRWPMDRVFTARLPSGKPLETRFWLIDTDGSKKTYLVGTITGEG